jgi:hypothetical protein
MGNPFSVLTLPQNAPHEAFSPFPASSSTFNIQGQDFCNDIRQQDRMIIRTERQFFMKLKRVDTAKMDKQVLSTMNAAIIKETSPAFFKSIKLKQVRIHRSCSGWIFH